MNVKIDTKEKFSVITPLDAGIPANMSEELGRILTDHLQKPIPHLVLNMEHIAALDPVAAEKIALVQESFYLQNASFIVCCMKPDTEAVFEAAELLELMNVTPTESEAWDIVQMEEIERELLNDFDEGIDEKPERS
ncbi:MAG: hypothetical protein JWQ27_2862 [Ferruginibacter sp.]|nr:hypothetical protein [Ferruginibacter sp.]